MSEKEPVLLVILIDTTRMRWLAGGIGFDGAVYPLLASEEHNIASYREMDFDEQILFLRHRLCGALARGWDRLWGLEKKAGKFVFVTDQQFPDASPQLTDRVAKHLVQWMANPPVVFLSANEASFAARPVELTTLAGDVEPQDSALLTEALPVLLDLIDDSDRWEMVPTKRPKG